MRMPSKRVFIIIGAVLGGLVAVALAFVFFFPKDFAVAEMERRIEAATERELTIGGDVQLTFWPALGFSAEQASLSNPEGFSDAPFLAADRIVFAVQLWPLLRGDIQVKQLILDHATFNLEAKDDGAANWAFPTEQTGDDPVTIEDLRLDEVRLSSGTISFRGEQGDPLLLENVDAALELASLDNAADFDGAFDYRGQRLTFETEVGLPRALLEKGQTPLVARLSSDLVSGAFQGNFDAATGALSGAADANGESLRAVMAWLGTPLGEGDGFAGFGMRGQVALEGPRTVLTQSTFLLDAIEARGDVTLETQADDRLMVTGALATTAIDFNPYLPPPSQGAAGPGVEVDTAWSTAPLDLSGLRALDADLRINAQSLRFQRMTFSNAAMTLRIANGAADARLTEIALYGGTGSARLVADGSGAAPRVAFVLDAQNVQALPLLTDAIGLDKIEGRGRLVLSVAGQGASQAAIMRGLVGTAAFNFNDGAWRGVNLAQMARTVQALATGQRPATGSETDFAEMAADFRVAGGVAATDNLRLLNPFVRLDGAGSIDIGAQTIDLRLSPRAVRSAQGQGGDATLQGIGVPFRVSGPWSNVSFRPDIGDVVRDRAREILERQDGDSPLGQLGEAIFGRREQPKQD